jgi:hypothetical protein
VEQIKLFNDTLLSEDMKKKINQVMQKRMEFLNEGCGK